MSIAQCKHVFLVAETVWNGSWSWYFCGESKMIAVLSYSLWTRVYDDNLSHAHDLCGLKLLSCVSRTIWRALRFIQLDNKPWLSNGTSSGTTLYSRLMICLIAVCSIRRATPIRFQPTLGTLLVMCDFLCMEPCCCMTIPHKCGICHLLCRCTHITPTC